MRGDALHGKKYQLGTPRQRHRFSIIAVTVSLKASPGREPELLDAIGFLGLEGAAIGAPFSIGIAEFLDCLSLLYCGRESVRLRRGEAMSSDDDPGDSEPRWKKLSDDRWRELTKDMTEAEAKELKEQARTEISEEEKRLSLVSLAGNYSIGCFASAIASIFLLTYAFAMESGGTYGFWAIVLAGCCVYCYYRRGEIKQQIEQRDY